MTEEQLVQQLEIIQKKQADFTLEFKKAENMMQKAYEGSLDILIKCRNLWKR